MKAHVAMNVADLIDYFIDLMDSSRAGNAHRAASMTPAVHKGTSAKTRALSEGAGVDSGPADKAISAGIAGITTKAAELMIDSTVAGDKSSAETFDKAMSNPVQSGTLSDTGLWDHLADVIQIASMNAPDEGADTQATTQVKQEEVPLVLAGLTESIDDIELAYGPLCKH